MSRHLARTLVLTKYSQSLVYKPKNLPLWQILAKITFATHIFNKPKTCTDKKNRRDTIIPSFILTQELILKESTNKNFSITSKEHLQK